MASCYPTRVESAVDVDVFISAAIDAGTSNGIEALDPAQRLVFLIAEAEALCDIDGIDSFLGRYAPAWITEAAAAFEAIGAGAIAAELRAAPLDAPVGDPRLDRLNALITGRFGYDSHAIRRAVEERREEGRGSQLDLKKPKGMT